MGNAIIFIWGPNFKMLPPLHRTLGSTHRGRPNSQKWTRGGAGLRHGARRRIRCPPAGVLLAGHPWPRAIHPKRWTSKSEKR